MNRMRWAEIFRFCLVGGASFMVDYGLLYFCTEALGLRYLYSSAISFTVSVAVNYWLCVAYVFREIGDQTPGQMLMFGGSSLVGLGLNQICMWFLVEHAGIYYMFAKLVATAVVMVWNYVMKRKALQRPVC